MSLKETKGEATQIQAEAVAVMEKTLPARKAPCCEWSSESMAELLRNFTPDKLLSNWRVILKEELSKEPASFGVPMEREINAVVDHLSSMIFDCRKMWLFCELYHRPSTRYWESKVHELTKTQADVRSGLVILTRDLMDATTTIAGQDARFRESAPPEEGVFRFPLSTTGGTSK